MSTFNGIVSEFPRIRIDYFRSNSSQPPPLACFLSHIHSDHLQGLESLKAPFVYCSPATRRLLLRMEKYPHRMNFAKGILEVRKQTYRHLHLILKAIPLQTPTEIELGPKLKIRVTLFDANHCPGAVMFLIEGDGKAILYTGDVRSEHWWVNSIVRNPVLVPYTLGQKRLDCIYLDTTFATKNDVYHSFPAKATGLQELLQKVQNCPPETVFYFRAWTLGYEDVWVALSAALETKVHVDEYQIALYHSLSENSRDGFSVPEAPALNGFQVGNHTQPGCLTTDSSLARVHSCEPGTACHAKLTKDKTVVWITPIITRSREGADVYEIGAGGGGGDLYQTAELDVTDMASTEALASLCVEWIKDPEELSNALRRLSSARTSRSSKISLNELGLEKEEGISLKQLVSRMATFGDQRNAQEDAKGMPGLRFSRTCSSNAIHFPYSRHASYDELRHLVSAFKPRDVCPCTVDEETWCEEVSMGYLFGDLCSGCCFDHDHSLRSRLRRKNIGGGTGRTRKRKREDQQETQESETSHEACETANGSFELHATEAAFPDRTTTSGQVADTLLATKRPAQKQTPNVQTNGSEHKRDRHAEIPAFAEADTSQMVNTHELHLAKPLQDSSCILRHARASSVYDLTEEAEPHSSPDARLEAIKAAFAAITRDSDTASGELSGPPDKVNTVQKQDDQADTVCEKQAIPSGPQDTTASVTGEDESQLSLSTSAFESQPQVDGTQGGELLGLQLDGISDRPFDLLEHNEYSKGAPDATTFRGADADSMDKERPSEAVQTSSRRIRGRKEAYRAARRCLFDGADTGGWEDLSLRSVGRRGHTEAEMEL